VRRLAVREHREVPYARGQEGHHARGPATGARSAPSSGSPTRRPGTSALVRGEAVQGREEMPTVQGSPWTPIENARRGQSPFLHHVPLSDFLLLGITGISSILVLLSTVRVDSTPICSSVRQQVQVVDPVDRVSP